MSSVGDFDETSRKRDTSGRFTVGAAAAKAKTAALAKYARAKAPHKTSDVLKHIRAEFMADGNEEAGYAQGTTQEIAESLGTSAPQMLKVLQKAAKDGLISRRGHEKSFGSATAHQKGFGFQIWELRNKTKIPED